MKFAIRMSLVGMSALALAACGDSNDASDEVIAEDVEIVADDALTDVTDEPVEDDAVEAPAPAPVQTQSAEERQEAVRQSVQDEADAAEKAAADITAELEGMNTEN